LIILDNRDAVRVPRLNVLQFPYHARFIGSQTPRANQFSGKSWTRIQRKSSLVGPAIQCASQTLGMPFLWKAPVKFRRSA